MIESDLETRLLLEALYEHFGYDFRNYSPASLRRRLEAILARTGDESLSLLQHRVLHQPGFFPEMLQSLTVTTSEMFRDPLFFAKLRSIVCPMLQTYPTLNIWHAGCSSGEEVYSLAILLHEEGRLERATIYATDINRGALARAREGIYATEDVRKFTASYQRAGGKRSFADYYTAAYDAVQFESHLRRKIVFSEHNLVTDGVFCESHLILCRNVLILFPARAARPGAGPISR